MLPSSTEPDTLVLCPILVSRTMSIRQTVTSYLPGCFHFRSLVRLSAGLHRAQEGSYYPRLHTRYLDRGTTDPPLQKAGFIILFFCITSYVHRPEFSAWFQRSNTMFVIFKLLPWWSHHIQRIIPTSRSSSRCCLISLSESLRDKSSRQLRYSTGAGTATD